MEGRPRSQPDDLINFRQLRSNALQAAELDIYDGDDIRFVILIGIVVVFSFFRPVSLASSRSRIYLSFVCSLLALFMVVELVEFVDALGAAAVVVVALKPYLDGFISYHASTRRTEPKRIPQLFWIRVFLVCLSCLQQGYGNGRARHGPAEPHLPAVRVRGPCLRGGVRDGPRLRHCS